MARCLVARFPGGEMTGLFICGNYRTCFCTFERPFNRVTIILLFNTNIKIKINLLRMTYNFN